MRLLLLLGVLLSLASCAKHQTRVIETPETRELKGWQKPYEVDGQRYQPLRDHQGFSQRGIASWYGRKFHGRRTSNGEIYDMYAMTAAHKTLPLGVDVLVTNQRNGKSVKVRVNDRGPFVAGRVIDLSFAAARQLDIVDSGTAPVEVVALGFASLQGGQVGYTVPVNYDAGHFALQVGAFSQVTNAERFAASLRPRFGRAEVHPGDADGRTLYRVRVGDFSSLHEAEAARERVRQDFAGVFVVAFE
jgi:rare lipoprotein A